MTAPNRSETFGRLLKAAISSIANCEGKTAPVVEDELGEQIGIAGKSIQRYKTGYLPPDPRTVAILAEACVRRGYMNREWLQSFLHAARYHQADKLLDQICPLGPVRPRPPRVYENLPAPTYSQFVMRAQAFAEVIDGLGKRSAAVLLVGLGGNGKTSLAREVAAHCLRDSAEVPRFDAVVWVSDKDRPGTTNLSLVLDEIARTLDYPGFTQFEHDEKRREVEQLLRRQKVLLVVDNFETVTDGALLTWLLNLPEPSKALITSREKHRALWSSWLVELRGMSEGEAQTLIAQRLQALQLRKIASDRAQFEPLIIVTGGNPKALEITLGLIKHERRSLQQIVDDLYAARGEIFEDLFARAWALLDEAARRVLLVATFFPASASDEALSASADVQGFALERAMERLADLALLDVQQANLSSSVRYALHPLVRSFARMQLFKQTDLEKKARERWIAWCLQYSSQVGYCWDDLKKLTLLDIEHETVWTAMHWAFQHGYYTELNALARGSRYYYQVRGGWIKRIQIEQMRYEALRKTQDSHQIISAIRNIIEGSSRLGELEKAEKMVKELLDRTNSIELSIEEVSRHHTILGIYWIAHRNYDLAQQMLRRSLENEDLLSTTQRILSRRWLATCLLQQGYIDEARQQFENVLQFAEHVRHARSIIYCRLHLAAIEIQQGNPVSAAPLLATAREQASLYQDRERIALISLLTARLHTLRGDLPAARAALAEAIDLFERLGMRRELAEARAELAQLDAAEAPEPGASGA